MLGIFKRDRKRAPVPKRRHSRESVPRGGLENFAASDGDMPEEAYGAADESAAEAMAEEPAADNGAVPMDTELARECRESRLEAERRMRADDQKRQTVFACACVVAGFCGITGVIFGTAAVCSRLGQSQQTAMAGAPGVVEGYYQQQGSQEIWYDAGGRMHVNVHITREPDREINIYIDQDGNVSTGAPAAAEGHGEDDGTAGAPADGDGAGQGAQDGVPAGDGAGDNEGDQSGQDGTGEDGGHDEGRTDAAIPKTEAEILAEVEERRKNGGSGYSESDVQYVIRRGDTLSAISNETGFSVDFLAAYNCIADKNLIITGEVLRYPSFVPSE